MFRPKILLALAAVLALGFGARSASADTFGFDLTTGNSAISGTPGPYAHVVVDTGMNPGPFTSATITFTAYSGFALTDGSSVGVNVNGSFNVATASITESSSIGTGANFKDTSSGNVSTFGSFNFLIDNKGSFSDSATTISFVVTATGGNSWASASAVLTQNDTTHKAIAEAHIGVLASGNGSFTNTGFAAGSGTSINPLSTPEPSTLAIAGLGALGFIGFGIRRRLTK